MWPNIAGRRYSAIRCIFNHCDVSDLHSYRFQWNNAKSGLLRRSRSFKVTEVGTNRKPVCNFLYQWLILTDILSRTVYKLSQIIAQILDDNRRLCVFVLPLEDLGAAYTSGLLTTHFSWKAPHTEKPAGLRLELLGGTFSSSINKSRYMIAQVAAVWYAQLILILVHYSFTENI